MEYLPEVTVQGHGPRRAREDEADMSGILGSIVVPCFNEETNIAPFYEALTRVIDPLDTEFEIIFVDDGSTDATYAGIARLASSDNRIKSIKFSRNFGSHIAFTAGIHMARGDFAVMMSVDLQDPPELIPKLIEQWQQGYHVVWAARETRDDPLSKKLFAAAFYKILGLIALPGYPATGMDFGLIDRRVMDALKGMAETNAFLYGSIFWLGFRQTSVPYHRRKRFSGTTKWGLGKNVKTALDALVSFSYVPIRLVSYLGIAVCLFSFFYAADIIVGRLFLGRGGELGWPSIMVTMLSLGGAQLIILGMLGEYIWRTLDQVRGRPKFIVMESAGFEERQTPTGDTGAKTEGSEEQASGTRSG
jgi:polyisoprenyl-phosphate glycosyltransferase